MDLLSVSNRFWLHSDRSKCSILPVAADVADSVSVSGQLVAPTFLGTFPVASPEGQCYRRNFQEVLWRNWSPSVVAAFSLVCFVEPVEVLWRMLRVALRPFLEVSLDVMSSEMFLPVAFLESFF